MIKKHGEKWQVDIQPGGRGCKRYRKTFTTKTEALRYERKLQANQGYEPQKKDTRTLEDIIEQWWQLKGTTLISGKDSYNRLKSAVQVMGNPLLNQLTPIHFAEYRTKRIESGINPATLNRELKTFNAAFTELIRLGQITTNPFQHLQPIKHQQPQMVYLTEDQIKELMQTLQQTGCDAYLIALVCLSTGARWGEAQRLTKADIQNGKIRFHETKSKQPRSVPISQNLQDQLNAVLHQRTFTEGYSTFSRRLAELGYNLPRGQRSHVLRHTFASYFIMNGGNILTLQKVLGHSSLEMTMRYAHLSPDYLNEVLDKNPALTLC